MIRKREGFTLVELLVVIAIIIILAAILFPVFAKAREKAQQSKCINNLKQMGAAIAMYEDDYDTIMPWFVTPAEVYGYSWKDLMNPYLKQLKGGRVAGYDEAEGEVFKCPSAPVEQMTIDWRAGRNYGYNSYLRNTVSTTQVKFPGSTLRITETDGKDPDGPPDDPDPGGSWTMPIPDDVTGTGAGEFARYAPGWHNGMNNCLWVDGHVSSMTRQRVMMTDNNRDSSGRVGNVWARLAPKPAATPEG